MYVVRTTPLHTTTTFKHYKMGNTSLSYRRPAVLSFRLLIDFLDLPLHGSPESVASNKDPVTPDKGGTAKALSSTLLGNGGLALEEETIDGYIDPGSLSLSLFDEWSTCSG